MVGFVPDSHPNIAVLLFVLINTFFGANCGGFYKCGTLVSRQYSGFVISNIQFIKCITLFLAPALVSLFVTNDSDKTQWRTIFLFFSALIILSNALFCYMATDEPANFTLLSRESKEAVEISKEHFTTVPKFPPQKEKEIVIES
uniref:Uncharacterized protein n=1 Tax=Panagrolaimus superbus TaxID=310955 RepID=A0A914XZJ3_9BILA